MKRTSLLLSLLLALPALAQTDGATAASLNFWVNASAGSDGATCTLPNQACKSIQGALDKVPKRIRNPVIVNVAAGSYPCFVLTGFTVEMPSLANASVGQYLAIVGHMNASVLAAGTTSGVLTSNSSATAFSTTFTDSAQTWTSSDLKQRFIKITSGTQSGNTYPIYSNTGTAVTVPGVVGAVLSGASYSIIEPDTVITQGTLCQQSATFHGASANSGMVIAAGNTMAGTTGQFAFYNLKFSLTSGTGYVLSDAVRYHIRNNVINATTGTGWTTVKGASVQYQRNIVNITSTGFGAFTESAAPSLGLFSANNYIKGGTFGIQLASGAAAFQVLGDRYEAQTTTGIGVFGGSFGYISIAQSTFDGASGAGTAIKFTSTPATQGVVFIMSSDISNWTTGIAADSPGALIQTAPTGGVLTGSTNTTAYLLTNGAKLRLDSGATLTGTTELSLDGDAYSMTTFRAMSPKALNNLAYGTAVYQ